MCEGHGGFAAEAEYDPRASRERSSAEAIRGQVAYFAGQSDVRELLDAVPGALLIVNGHRQVVFANRALREMVELPTMEGVYGRRPGEILDCEHASECDTGCGASEGCVVCGAAKAVAACERGAEAVQECRIIQKGTGKALDLRVSTKPMEISGERFTIVAMTDIGHEKRRAALERIFFHDVMNTVGAILGHAELLRRTSAGDAEVTETISRLTNTLVEEIRAQRDLLSAERDDLATSWEPVGSLAVLGAVVQRYRKHGASEKRGIMIDSGAADVWFPSDAHLLSRVLSNMAKNGLEACSEGQTVTLGCKAEADAVEFRVHNPGFMPREVQLQVFQRSFSTKGAGRGLGTYSIKLLSERYLGGRVSFTTSEEEGTTFRGRYPRTRGGHV